MKLKTLLTLAVASLCSWQGAWADDVVANVTLKEKNSLSSEILALSGIDDLKTVTHLTVSTNSGVKLGDDDWATLKTMTALVNLDLSNACANRVPNEQFHYFEHLTTVKLPKDITSIGDYAFNDSYNLVTVVVPNTVTSIGYRAFDGCRNLETCDFSACQLTEIPYQCFIGCSKLNSFIIPATVTVIEGYAFSGCSQFSSTLPSGLKKIGGWAFSSAAMTDMDIVIPEGVDIEGDAFTGSGIKSIELPSTYYKHNDAYRQCSNLQTVTLKSPTVVSFDYGYRIYEADANHITLQVPSHLVAAYKSHSEWSKCQDIVAISSAVTDYTVSADLSLSNSYMRLEGSPNVFFTEKASLTIAGNAAQSFGDFTASANYDSYYDYNTSVSKIFNESANVTINGDFKQRIYTKRDDWYFLCLPFDFVVGDVTAENGVFVIRAYDGAKRNNNNSSSGNWSGNLADDVEIKAGTGFIIRTSEKTWVTFKAKTGGTNYAFYKESDEIIIPLAANNSNTEASKANTGWNMVGNPWQTFYNIHKLNYTAPFAVYNGYSYDTYSPADDDYALRPFQALFVQCPNGITSIDFPAAGRQMTSEVTSQNGARRLVNNGRRLFDINVSDGTLSDKTRLVVNADATMDYEIGRDANKFFAGGTLAPQIYTLDGDGIQYAINERPAGSGTLRLGMLFASDGEYTLSAVRNDIGQVILTDNVTGIKTDLQEHGYTFEADGGTCESRFTLSFGDAVTGISMAQANGPIANEVYTLNGTKVGNITDGLQKGVYVVRQGQQTQKVIIK